MTPTPSLAATIHADRLAAAERHRMIRSLDRRHLLTQTTAWNLLRTMFGGGWTRSTRSVPDTASPFHPRTTQLTPLAEQL